jgi:hypothetical protein
MSKPADPNPRPERPGFDSLNCKILEFDGPGDTTQRPCPPELLAIRLAERERYVQAGLLPPWTGPWPAKGQGDVNQSGENAQSKPPQQPDDKGAA